MVWLLGEGGKAGECWWALLPWGVLHLVILSSSPAVKLEILDVEKVKGLSNYYVREPMSCTAPPCDGDVVPCQAYIIKVVCQDGSSYHIYRRYSQFDEVQNALEKRFPIEAGSINARERVLPRLPGDPPPASSLSLGVCGGWHLWTT